MTTISYLLTSQLDPSCSPQALKSSLSTAHFPFYMKLYTSQNIILNTFPQPSFCPCGREPCFPLQTPASFETFLTLALQLLHPCLVKQTSNCKSWICQRYVQEAEYLRRLLSGLSLWLVILLFSLRKSELAYSRTKKSHKFGKYISICDWDKYIYCHSIYLYLCTWKHASVPNKGQFSFISVLLHLKDGWWHSSAAHVQIFTILYKLQTCVYVSCPGIHTFQRALDAISRILYQCFQKSYHCHCKLCLWEDICPWSLQQTVMVCLFPHCISCHFFRVAFWWLFFLCPVNHFNHTANSACHHEPWLYQRA